MNRIQFANFRCPLQKNYPRDVFFRMLHFGNGALLDADLRVGDIVAVENADHTFGRTYRTGAVTVGVVVHSRCTTAGHGPGVTTLMSSSEGKIEPVIDRFANIADCLGIGRCRGIGRRRPESRPKKPRR